MTASVRGDRGFPGGRPFITPTDKALDEAIERAQEEHALRLRPVAEAEGLRVLGPDVMAVARWTGPNQFTVGRRAFAVTVAFSWGPDGAGGAVPIEHPVLYFKHVQGGGHRGGVRDYVQVRTLCELAEREDMASQIGRRA